MKKIINLAIIICCIFLCSCSNIKKNTVSESTPMVSSFLETAIPKETSVAYSSKEKLEHTEGYLVYDSSKGTTINLNLEGVSDLKTYDKVECYDGKQFITDNTYIYPDKDEYLLCFDIKEFVDYFDTIKIYSGNDSEFINVGSYYIDKIKKNTISKDQWVELVSYEEEDAFNKYSISCTVSNTGDDDIECYIPEKLLKKNYLDYNFEYKKECFSFDCSIENDTFKKQNLYSIEFDIVIYQKDAKNNFYKIVSCFIPLTQK